MRDSERGEECTTCFFAMFIYSFFSAAEARRQNGLRPEKVTVFPHTIITLLHNMYVECLRTQPIFRYRTSYK